MLSEDEIEFQCRINAREHDGRLFRNNVGVLQDRRGVPVRFGLCNDTAAVNKKYKSGDLIGWRTVLITPEMVGRRFALFVSRECKAEGWHFAGDEHEQAQLNWANLVNEAGGDACFVATRDGFVNPHFTLRHHAR